MRACVTGGAGFVGRCLVQLLLERGWAVQVLDDFSTGLWNEVFLPGVKVFRGDIVHYEDLKGLFSWADAVFHLAAVPRWAGFSKPLCCLEVNGLGTLKVLLAAREARIRHFVHVSSGSVSIGPDVKPESFEPENMYGLSKAVGELYAKFFQRYFEVSILRPFHVYGRGMGPAENIFTRFIKAALADEPLTIYGDGSQRLSVTWVGDAARACFWTLEHSGFYAVAGETITVNDLADQIIGLIGSGRKESIGMPDWAYGDHTSGCDRLVRAGFSFEGTLEKKLPETIESLRNWKT